VLPVAVIRGEYGSVVPALEQEWRLRASASYCILLPYNATTGGSSMLCYHEGLEMKCKLDEMQVRH
jgi:hypothetical protein